MSVRFFIFLIFSSQSCRCVFIFRSASTSFRLSSFLLRPRERLTQAAYAKEFYLKYCGIPRLCRNLWKVAATIFGEIGTVLGMAASLSTFAKEKTARTETNLKRRKSHTCRRREDFSPISYTSGVISQNPLFVIVLTKVFILVKKDKSCIQNLLI